MQQDKDTEMQVPAGDRTRVVATFARKVVPRVSPCGWLYKWRGKECCIVHASQPDGRPIYAAAARDGLLVMIVRQTDGMVTTEIETYTDRHEILTLR